MRLQKFMADAGVASRRKCEEYISAGRVKVNGAVAEIGCTVEPGDKVEFDGRLLTAKTERVVIMLNKPQGVVCTCSDPEGRKTVIDYVKDLPYRLYNVGRLDYDSEGLILLTNDGDLAYRMTHPKFEMDKTYHVVCSGTLDQRDISRLQSGITLDDGVTSPAQVNNVHIRRDGKSELDITIHEGRNRQVRRMIAAVGKDTLLLRRIKEGPLELAELKTGQWRFLTEQEIKTLDPVE
ncbi:MAG: rRNA pseudouridine synthase [Clostridia bacterium]|nr:rRNA pseudouridine synthase [Clostridia bacterium]